MRIILKSLYVLLLSSLLAVWLMQDSIGLYWQQAYHQDSPLENLDEFTAWQLGAQLNQQVLAQKYAGDEQLAQFDRKNIDAFNYVWLNKPLSADNILVSVIEKQTEPEEPKVPAKVEPKTTKTQPCVCGKTAEQPVEQPVEQPTVTPIEKVEAEENTLLKSRLNANGQVILRKGDRVFYVGDSLMQGVAPHAKRALYKNYGIEGIDLSKQSTGLAYPSYFNWPKTVADTFKNYDDIRLMVVYLGPNDPWSFAKEKGQPYLKFKSAEWEEIYRERIRSLIATAHQHNAHVIWLGAPNMKRDKLNMDMQYLNELYRTEIQAANELYRSTRDVLGSSDAKFVNFVQMNGRNVKVRVDDGIHFTLAGQRLVSDTILSLIDVEPEPTPVATAETLPAAVVSPAVVEQKHEQ